MYSRMWHTPNWKTWAKLSMRNYKQASGRPPVDTVKYVQKQNLVPLFVFTHNEVSVAYK